MSNSPFCLSTHAQKRWPCHLLLMTFRIISMTQLSTYHLKKFQHILFTPWWCRSRLYFLSINGLMKASTVYISLVKMYYIFQTQCLCYYTSMQTSLKLVGNEIIFYWWLHPRSLHTCMQVYNRCYLSNRILNIVWHQNVASLPMYKR